MYDVIVVGARCAGAPLAMLLARKGYRVLLLDRATFPSDIPHGHFIHRHGPRRLQAWGLLDRVVATGCPAVTSFTFDAGDFPLTGHDLIADGVAMGYGPRRAALDNVLATAAAEAGAELREGFIVEEFTSEAGRITGVRGRARNGATPVTERATVTVGADGRNSRLARAVQAPEYQAVPTLACWYFSYWSNVTGRALELHAKGKRIIFAFPTNDDLFAVFIAWPIEELPVVRPDIERQFMAALALAPELAERIQAGRREERFYGATDLPHFLRRPYGDGWALVGDAGPTRTPTSRWASATRSVTRSCWPMRSTRDSRAASARAGACRVRAPAQRSDPARLSGEPGAGALQPASRPVLPPARRAPRQSAGDQSFLHGARGDDSHRVVLQPGPLAAAHVSGGRSPLTVRALNTS